MKEKLKKIKIGLLIVLLGTLGFYSFKITEKNKSLVEKVTTYKEQEIKLDNYENQKIKLDNMEKTLVFCYGLTPYEARYYSIIFDDFSQKYKIPWEVYPALIKIESNFNSGVMSKKRAKGMTQVLESTGKMQAQKLGIPFNEGTLWNCVLNMVIGFDYFSEGFTEKIDNTSIERALKHAMRRYCGGPDYDNKTPEALIYIKEYKTTVWDEYLKVSYIYKGIKFDQAAIKDKKNTDFASIRPHSTE